MKIGVLGAGQLALMLAEAAEKLKIHLIAYDPSIESCAKQKIEVTHGAYQDLNALDAFISACDVITYETENLSVDCVKRAKEKLHPPCDALAISQDRLLEKDFLNRLHVKTAPYNAIHSSEDLKKYASNLPAILKTRRDGYDGKGQFVLMNETDISTLPQEIFQKPLILEGFVKFDCEVSLISVRSKKGEILFYPLTLNKHVEGILTISRAPHENKCLQQQAETHARNILEKWEYVGVLTIEFFVCGDELIANEMAPRVHNSGHWTIEGAITSQFENHIRAIAGLPLGETTAIGKSVMVNFIGEAPNQLSIPHASLHNYGKTPRAKRKVGHVTICHEDEHVIEASLQKLQE